jgi:Transmembrane amino acid transporter protein
VVYYGLATPRFSRILVYFSERSTYLLYDKATVFGRRDASGCTPRSPDPLFHKLKMYRRKTRKMGNIVSGVEDLHHVYEDVAVQHRRAHPHSPDAGIELTEQSDQVSPDEEVAPLVNDDVPHDLIAVPGMASNAQVAVNIIISFVGAGLLGIPDAFRSSGWALGSVALCTVSALNVYAMLLLVQVQQKLTKEGYAESIPAWYTHHGHTDRLKCCQKNCSAETIAV